MLLLCQLNTVSGRTQWRSKVLVCGRQLAGIVGSNPAGGMDVSLVSAVCFGLITRPEDSSTECGMSDCDRETSTMRSLGLLGLSSHEKKNTKDYDWSEM